MPKLYVAMYRPTHGNIGHWALYLKDWSEHTIYEVVGEPLDFRASVLSAIPDSTLNHRRNICMCDLAAGNVEDFKETVAGVKDQNSIQHWNSQDYVMKALDRLVEQGVVDAHEDTYVRAKKRVTNLFGLEFHHLSSGSRQQDFKTTVGSENMTGEVDQHVEEYVSAVEQLVYETVRMLRHR